MKILKIKQPDGTIVNVPLGKGADGKSAYEYAQDGGYTGTEAEFAQLLGNINNGGSANDYTLPEADTSLGGVKSGGDVTISSGIITVNDDSHNHTIANVDNLQATLDNKANKTEGTFYVEGSGTTDATAKTSTWVGSTDRITEYYDGLTIRYKIGVEGQSSITLNINNLGAKTVYRFGTTKLTTQFPVGSIINLIYHTDLNNGCWMCSDYDSNTNTQQRVYESSGNTEYAITARYNTTDGASYYAEYGRYTNGVTLNPSTNTITATAFKGKLTGNADTATKATQDGNGKVIADTYETKTDASKKITSHNTSTTAHADIREQISQLSSEKADKLKVASYITPEMYNAKGDGKTDDSAAIQQAINAAINSGGCGATVYMARKKYAISTGLVINTMYDQPINFICDGDIIYSGTGAAITLESSNFSNIEIFSIWAENGTAFKTDSTAGELGSNIVTIHHIRASKIGLHLLGSGGAGTTGHNTFYNKFHIEGGINSTETCVYIDADTKLVNENFFWLGRLFGGAQYGIRIDCVDGFGGAAINGNASRNVFFCGDIEGISATGYGIYLHNTSSNVFRNMRCEEAYGAYSIVLSGECFANDIECSYINIEQVDISALTVQNQYTSQYANVLRSTKLLGEGFYNDTEAFVSSNKGFFKKQADNTWEAWTFTMKDGSVVTKQVSVT